MAKTNGRSTRISTTCGALVVPTPTAGGRRRLGPLLVHFHERLLVHPGDVEPVRPHVGDAVEIGPHVIERDAHAQRREVVIEPAAVFQPEPGQGEA